jgi:hypothetical protein
MRNLALLASSALASAALYSPEGMGNSPGVPPLQSYDVNLPGYISPGAMDFLPLEMQGNVLKAAPVVMAQLAPSAVAEGLAVTQLPDTGLSDSDLIADLQRRVGALEQRDSRANSVLDWAEKVLNKYHDNPADKPEAQFGA